MLDTVFIKNEFSPTEMGRCTAVVAVDGQEISFDWMMSDVDVQTRQELIDYLCNEAIKKYNQTRAM